VNAREARERVKDISINQSIYSIYTAAAWPLNTGGEGRA